MFKFYSREKFEDLEHIEGEKRKAMSAAIERWWSEFIFQGRNKKMDVDHFVDMLNKEYSEDKAKFKKFMMLASKTYFEMVDLDHDGFYTKQQYIDLWVSYGHDDLDHLQIIANESSNARGMVPVDAQVREWFDFVTSEDRSKALICQHALAIGVDKPEK